MGINLKTLIGKLNDTCRQAAERAASLCMARGNWEVDLEHLFLALMEQPRSDLALVVRRSGIAPGRLEQDLSAGGLGVRSQRYSMLVDDGVVKALNVEAPGKFEVSDAATMLGQVQA